AVDVVATRGVEVRVARHAHVDHRRHVELDHLLVERVPPLVRERRGLPVTPRGGGGQGAAEETEFLYAPPQLGDAVGRGYTRGLRELADAHEALGKQRAHAMDQIVALLRPVQAGRRVADVVPHTGRTRREDGYVGSAFSLQFQLCLFY